jgi:hypothetical protein
MRSEDDQTPELAGIILGAAVGAAPIVRHWFVWGRFHPYQDEALGFPVSFYAVPCGVLGAVIGYFIAYAVKRRLRRR